MTVGDEEMSDDDYEEDTGGGNEDGGQQDEESGEPFDDEVPADLPVGVGNQDPIEEAAVQELSTNHIMHYEMVDAMIAHWPHMGRRFDAKHMRMKDMLRCMFMHEEHRSHVYFKDPKEVAKILHYVQLQAAYREARDLTREQLISLGMGSTEEDGGREKFMTLRDQPDVGVTNEPWIVAANCPVLAGRKFGELNGQLNGNGFFIFEGLLNSDNMPESVAVGRNHEQFPKEFVDLDSSGTKGTVRISHETTATKLRESIRDMFNLVGAEFPAENVRNNDSNLEKWACIVNERGEDEEKQKEKGQGRYMSTRKYMTEHMEQQDVLAPAVKARATLDLVICAMMKMVTSYEQGKDIPAMFVPATGGRFLATVRGTERQKLHTDFETSYLDEVLADSVNPGYFAMATGAEPAEVMVARNSHRMYAVHNARDDPVSLGRLGSGYYTEIVRIPPWSVFVARGDLPHGGCGFHDRQPIVTSEFMLRYHMYFIPHGVEVGNLVNLCGDFAPVCLDDMRSEDGEDGDDE